MISFLEGLFNNLLATIITAIKELEDFDLPQQIDEDFYNQIIDELNELKTETLDIINSGDLLEPSFASFLLREYNRIYDHFCLIESSPYQAILRFNEKDKILNQLVSRIYCEIQEMEVLDVPYISTLGDSEEYFWANPFYNLIGIPYGLALDMLNLPDLYHEIGHLIFQNYRNDLSEKFITDQVMPYSEELISIAQDDGMDEDYIESLREVPLDWENRWIEEYICDLIGTYLVGVAYGWTNLKMCVSSSKNDELYKDGEVHPPDTSRMDMVFSMLDILGEDYTELQKEWNNLLTAVNNSKPDDYSIRFPHSLFFLLAIHVRKECEEIGLRSFKEQANVFEKPVSEWLNDAWREASRGGENYELSIKKFYNQVKKELKLTNENGVDC